MDKTIARLITTMTYVFDLLVNVIKVYVFTTFILISRCELLHLYPYNVNYLSFLQKMSFSDVSSWFYAVVCIVHLNNLPPKTNNNKLTSLIFLRKYILSAFLIDIRGVDFRTLKCGNTLGNTTI